jgi:hypothetical protein
VRHTIPPCVFTAIVTFWATGAGAECFVRPACEALKNEGWKFVFVAETRSVQSFDMDPQHVRFKIIEAFKGVRKDQRELDVRIFIRSSETIYLEQGKRYLVYATERKDGTWSLGCSMTRVIEPDDDELRALRKCSGR